MTVDKRQSFFLQLASLAAYRNLLFLPRLSNNERTAQTGAATQITHYCFFVVAEKVSGGSREQDCQKADSDIFPSCHCCREVSVADARPPSAESKTTTTPASSASAVGCVFQARRNNSL